MPGWAKIGICSKKFKLEKKGHRIWNLEKRYCKNPKVLAQDRFVLFQLEILWQFVSPKTFSVCNSMWFTILWTWNGKQQNDSLIELKLRRTNMKQFRAAHEVHDVVTSSTRFSENPPEFVSLIDEHGQETTPAECVCTLNSICIARWQSRMQMLRFNFSKFNLVRLFRLISINSVNAIEKKGLIWMDFVHGIDWRVHFVQGKWLWTVLVCYTLSFRLIKYERDLIIR